MGTCGNAKVKYVMRKPKLIKCLAFPLVNLSLPGCNHGLPHLFLSELKWEIHCAKQITGVHTDHNCPFLILIIFDYRHCTDFSSCLAELDFYIDRDLHICFSIAKFLF